MISKLLSWSAVFIYLTCVTHSVIGNDDTTNLEENLEEESVLVEVTQPKTFVADEEFVTVTTRYGQIQGFREHSSKGKPFYSFLGIPYAKPPVGSLRFKDPEFPDNWEEIRDGSVEPPACPQIDVMDYITRHSPPVFGEEDCLYLNVYTPQPTMERLDLPVLVYIHGGLFLSGSAKDYKPYDLLNEDVILVVIQYRLGILGFLSTEDEVMPGNLGLKDQTKALLWIHRNIEFFGGSPLLVTLFGSDAGAVSVHFQSLTHHTIGLFNRGIMQSGSALCPWGLGGVHREAAHHIGRLLKCTASKTEKDDQELPVAEEPRDEGEEVASKKEDPVDTDGDVVKDEEVEAIPSTSENEPDESQKETPKVVNAAEEKLENDDLEELVKEEAEESLTEDYNKPSSQELMECLQNIEADKLSNMASTFFVWNTMPLIFGPYADGTFIPETPEFLLREKRHKRLDLILGVNKDDGALITNSLFANEGRRLALKHHFQVVGPISLEFTDDDIAPLNMSIKAYDHYMKSLNVDPSNANNLTRLYTDRHYAVCMDLTAQHHAANNAQRQKKVFYYEMNHRGERTIGDRFRFSFGKEWISHGDELFYLFPMNESSYATRSEEDTTLTEIMTKMWYNFAKYGNPTPDESLGFTWEPFTKTEARHLALNPSPEMENDTRKEIREFWTSLPTRQNIMFFKDKFVKKTEEENDGEENNNDDDDEIGAPAKAIGEENNSTEQVKDEL